MRGMGIAAAVAMLAAPVLAETTSQTLFEHKHWQVQMVTFDDGSRACLAEVNAGNDSFTVWLFQDTTFRLQFFSTEWDFGDTGDKADLQIQVDRRDPWNLTAADLTGNSVLFDLPDNDTGVRFLVEVAQGSQLNLNTAAGEGVKWYSLAGSNASMRAMLECGDALTGTTNSNPFN